jgi:hypothetical protein
MSQHHLLTVLASAQIPNCQQLQQYLGSRKTPLLLAQVRSSGSGSSGTYLRNSNSSSSSRLALQGCLTSLLAQQRQMMQELTASTP